MEREKLAINIIEGIILSRIGAVEMMRTFCSGNHCHLFLAPTPLPLAVTIPKSARNPPTITSSSSCNISLQRRLSSGYDNTASAGISSRWLQKLLLQAIAGTLSLSLLASPLLAAATDQSAVLPPPPPHTELCREEDEEEAEEVLPEAVTNEGIVEEAWQVVNESFFGDAGSRPWSPEKWMEKKNYVLQNSIQSRSEAHDVIRKMLASLGDPYTRFLSPSEFSKMARYDVTGIGINLREIPDDHGAVKLKVLGIILDGPAHSAGVRQGDELMSVNGLDVKGKSAFYASSLLQGPKETFVTIEVKHGNCGPIRSIKVQRQPVARTPVFYRLEKMENGNISVGYMRIKEFNALARKDLVIALKHLQDSGASYLVLDLRDNPGGLVQAGVEVAKLFLNKGETVIYSVGRDSQVQKSIVAEIAPLVTSPLIVLVNNRTASASEIVVSALHENCKAVLVGEKTYGKGLIQSVFELRDGSGIVVTIGKYVTPNHMDINGNGIVPDFPRFPAFNEVMDSLSRCRAGR